MIQTRPGGDARAARSWPDVGCVGPDHQLRRDRRRPLPDHPDRRLPLPAGPRSCRCRRPTARCAPTSRPSRTTWRRRPRGDRRFDRPALLDGAEAPISTAAASTSTGRPPRTRRWRPWSTACPWPCPSSRPRSRPCWRPPTWRPAPTALDRPAADRRRRRRRRRRPPVAAVGDAHGRHRPARPRPTSIRACWKSWSAR